MNRNNLYMTFIDSDSSDAAAECQNARSFLLDKLAGDVDIEIRRDDPESMNAGTLLEIIAPIAIHGLTIVIAQYIEYRHHKGKVRLVLDDKSLVLEKTDVELENKIRTLLGDENAK